MEEKLIVLLVLAIVLVIMVIINIILVIKNKPSNGLSSNDIENIEKTINKTIDVKLDNQLKLINKENESTYGKFEIEFKNLKENISDLKNSFSDTNEMINNKLKEMLTINNNSLVNMEKNISDVIKTYEKSMKDSFEKLENKVAENLKEIRKENEKKLEKINNTVSEKLDETLNKRLQESFGSVMEQIGGVNKAIGEIKGLASDVGSLKNVLTNVKTKGIVGEIILGNIIKETLTVAQYDENVATKKNSSERVEFAIKLPNQDDSFIYLPIDSKLPLEAYHKIQDAQENGDVIKLKEARAELSSQIKKYAKDINTKYIDVPNTTDFAIMFLPIEGLYIEALNLGLFEELQTKFNINIAGPTTFTAILNALQMGFKTLAIQQKSSEVFTLLAAVKTEFDNFEKVLAKTQKHMSAASDELENLVGTRTRKIQSKLKSIDKIEDVIAQNIIDDND